MFKFVGLLVTISVLFADCNSHNSASDSSRKTSSANDTTPPVETRPPNSNYKPAFAGQTRAPGIKTKTPYEAKVISSGLKNPWGIAVLPDGRFLITQKGGTMRIATASGQLSDEITGLPPVNDAGQGGLLGLLIDPQFQTNRIVYWAYSENTSGGTLTAVAKGNLSADEMRIENVKVIYRATPAFKSVLQYGGRMVFDKNGNLVVGTGERFDPKVRVQAQQLNSALGKIVRITKDGEPAPGNPFIGKDGARPEIYSYGHRNVEGLDFNPQTGDLWACEFGPLGGDELNLIKPGNNYGWPVITYGLEYSGQQVGEGITQKDGMQQPVYYWDPVLSPSGMCFYTGDNMPEWKNNVFLCGLSSRHIARLVIKDNKVAGEERLLADEDQRFRDIIQGKDGLLYAVTDEGRLYKIGRK